MTVIAAKIYDGNIQMACDSMVTRGRHKKSTGYPCKIIEGKDFILGFCGDAVILPLLTMYSKNHIIGNDGDADRIVEWCSEFLEYVKKKTNEWKGSLKASLLLAHSSGLFLIEDWLPIKVDDWCATGSGYEHAESALYLGHTPVEAVDVAINLAYGCGGKITNKSITFNV